MSARSRALASTPSPIDGLWRRTAETQFGNSAPNGPAPTRWCSQWWSWMTVNCGNGRHAQGQRPLERDEGVGPNAGAGRAKATQTTTSATTADGQDEHAPNLDVGAHLKHLIVRLVHHKQELVVRPQTHQFPATSR